MESFHRSDNITRPLERPTIAYLALDVGFNLNSAELWSGVVAGAQEQDLNVIGVPGGNLSKMPNPQTGRGQTNILYELVNPTTVQGIVSWASTIQSSPIPSECLNEQELIDFHHRYEPLPIVTLTKPLPGYPVAVIENAHGMHDLMRHLIEEHGYRRIGFIRGPTSHPAAEERYRLYQEALAAHGLPLDEQRISSPGAWNREHGEQTIALFFDQRQLRPHQDLDVIMAASDLFALGALDALRQRGIRVPEDIALAGFNNSAEGQAANPPITSVANPFHNQGHQAVGMLAQWLRQGAVPERMVISSQLTVHQSCGCFDPSVAAAGSLPHPVDRGKMIEPLLWLRTQRERLLSEFASAISACTLPEDPSRWLHRIFDDFIASIDKRNGEIFLTTLREVLSAVVAETHCILPWQDVVSVLQRAFRMSGASQELGWQLESMWGQARTMIGEIAYRMQVYDQFQTMRQTQRLQTLSQTLNSTFDVPVLTDVLAAELPKFDIPSTYLALYDDPCPYQYPQPAPAWSRLVLAYNEDGRLPLPADGQRFVTRRLLPEGILPATRRHTLLLQALYFQNTPLGFLVFEVGSRDWVIYERLRNEINNALQSIFLIRRVQERSAEVARKNYILDTFIETVPDRIWFKDREGRFTRANKAHAYGLGLHDPSEQIGKTDFDFFNEQSAQLRFEEEQKIMRTGQPILDKEVSGMWPDGRKRWSLVTKMPLRDEHGDIIGTFGIARDISPLKESEDALRVAHQALQEKNAELEALNSSKDTFFSIISHDLRSPFTTLLGFAQMLDDQFEQMPPDKSKRFIQRIRGAAERQYALLENLLTWARFQRGALAYTPEPLPLKELIEEIEILFADKAEHKQIALLAQIPPDLMVYADAAMVNVVLRNIVSNALKFTPSGGRITLLAAAQNAHWVEIAIADTGIGLATEDLPKLFRIDTHYTQVGTAGEQGTGLGLSLCKDLITKHGGRIWVESEIGAGTTFRFTLPRSC